MANTGVVAGERKISMGAAKPLIYWFIINLWIFVGDEGGDTPIIALNGNNHKTGTRQVLPQSL